VAKSKATLTGISQAKNSLMKFVKDQFSSKDFLTDIGDTAKEQIKNRTRAGLEEYKQLEVTEGTIKRRKSLIKSGNSFDSKIVKASRSNLSLSGQLLESIITKANTLQSLVILSLEKSRKPYKGVKGQDLENKKTNSQINKDLEDRGRFFLFLSDKLKSQLESKLSQLLRKKLSLYNRINRKLNR
jgi:hypothetical protein